MVDRKGQKGKRTKRTEVTKKSLNWIQITEFSKRGRRKTLHWVGATKGGKGWITSRPVETEGPKRKKKKKVHVLQRPEGKF